MTPLLLVKVVDVRGTYLVYLAMEDCTAVFFSTTMGASSTLSEKEALVVPAAQREEALDARPVERPMTMASPLALLPQ